MAPLETMHNMRKKPQLRLVSLLLPASLWLAQPAAADTQVTTYVVKVQEERQQTRWSLTEWLKIKERMKAMDLWLAIFSDPKKDKFQPELMLSAAATRSKFSYTTTSKSGSSVSAEQGSLAGGALKAQLWLTNLISSSIGVRTLNVDLGGEAYHRQSGAFAADVAPGSATNASGSVPPASAARRFDLEAYTGDLRLFGRNIQDSSLVLKYGRYSMRNGITDNVPGAGSGTISGPVMAAELQLYVLRALGAEGNYVQYGKANEKGGFTQASGYYYDYQGFVEISLLRLVAGPYVEQWNLTTGLGDSIKTQEKGLLLGLKLQF